MKNLLLSVLLLALVSTGFSQPLSSYSFSAFSSTYNPVSTSFISYTGGGFPFGSTNYDDCFYSGIPIGFNFVYCGTTFTSLSASANCWVVLGQTITFSSYVNTYDNDLSNSSWGGYGGYNLQRPILAALWSDDISTGPNVRYATTGTAPNRVFTIEWYGTSFYPGSSPYISVEIILYETTNIIDFAYSQLGTGSYSLGRCAIGITGGAGAYPVTGAVPYWSLNNSSTSPTPSMSVETRTISGEPATNQVYRWSCLCSGKPTAGTDSATVSKGCSSYSSTIYLSYLSGFILSSGYTYQWQSSPDSLTWTNISGATVDTYTTTVTTTLYYRCIVYCTNSGLSDTSKAEGLYLYIPPTSITGTAILCVGATTTLSDATAGGSWISSTTTIATVGSGTGVVTGVSPGTAIISYKLSTGCSSSITVTVSPTPSPIAGIKTVCTGFTTALSDAPGGGTWTSSNTTIATVGLTTGIVTGISPGTATITYSLVTGTVCNAITTVTVNPTPLPITGIPVVCAGLTTTLSDPTPGGTWSSASTIIATVNPATGVVTGVSGGTTTISYTLSTGCAATITITVNPLPGTITGVTIVCVGQTTALLDAGGGTWSSSNTVVATVGISSGIVTGISSGTAIITYTLPTGCIATVVITIFPVPSAITGITSVCVGGTSILSDATTGGTWSSFNPGIANIGLSTGLMTGISAGTTTITYTIGFGCFATITVTVNPTPAAITGLLKVCVGSTTALSDAMTGGTWSSGTSAVAVVDSMTGIATGMATGTSTITYILGTGCSITTVVTVNPLPSAITGPTTVCAGATIALSDATAGGIWSSSNTAVATVSGFGIVTGIATGTATITYKVFSTGCIATSLITVSSAPAPISGITSVCIGATTTLSDIIGGGTWISGTTTVATVGYTTGIVTGISAGTATITYSLGGSCKVTTIVTVYPLPPAISGVATLCVGGITTFTGAGVWSSSSTGIATVSFTTGFVTGISAGTATITFTLFSTGCMTTKVVTVNPLPTAISGITTICIGATTTLSDATAGGSWSSSNTAIATIGSSTGLVSGIAGGTAIITYTLLSTGCATTTTVTVTSPPPPITGIATMCIGATTTLSDPSIGGTWTSSSTTIATVGLSTGIVTGISAGTATITYTPGSGCAVTKTVTVNPFPSPISGPSTLCVGATIILSDAGGGTWTSSRLTIATIGLSTGVVTGIALGTTTITYTLPTGCIITTTITVSPSPVIISGSTNICIGTTTTLSDAITGGTWSSGATGIATVGLISGIVTGVSAGTAIITYSLGSGCTITTTVTVGPSPLPITGTLIICVGATTTLSDATTTGTWSSSSTPVATIGITGIVTGIAAGTTTITYTLGCIAITTVTVSPTPVAITGPASVCQGLSITLSDAVAGGTWTSSNTTVAVVSLTSGIVSGITAGTATVTYSLGSGCMVYKTITVNPVAPITGSANVCTGLSTTLSDALTGGAWTSSNTSVAVISSTGIVTGIGPGTSTITYTLPTGCTSTKIITVNSVPSAITGITYVCVGQTTTLSDATIGGTWSSGAPGVATVGITSGIVSGITAGTATITYSLGSGCTVFTTVTVNPSSSMITGSANVCAGSSITLSDATAGGTWSSGNTTVATIGLTTGIVTAGLPGTTTITYTLPAGCSATKIITINPLPSVITGTTSVCVGQTTTLNNATVGGTWTSSATTIATIGLSTGIVTGVLPGTANITYTSGGCIAFTVVTVVPLPTTITGAPAVCVGQSVTLSNGSPGGIWSSASTTIATINPVTGSFTGMASGTVIISYTLGSGCSVFTTIIVNPTSPITGSSIVCVGQSIALMDTTLGGTWSCTSKTVSVGPGTGVVTGISLGVATIIYTTPKGCTASHTVTVNAVPAPITGGPYICLGQTTNVNDATPGGTWSSSNTIIADFTSAGVVMGYNLGTSTISYTVGGCAAMLKMYVVPLPGAIAPANVCVGQTTTLIGTGGGTWSTSGTTIASVGLTTGVVTGLKPGVATIAYILPTGCFASVLVTVNPLPTAITGASNLCQGQTTTFSDATPGGVWSSMNSAIASAGSLTGDVFGNSYGTTSIVYTLTSTGCQASKAVTVNPVPLPITGVSDICIGTTLTTLTDATPGGTWSSSLAFVGTIDSITGQFAGIAGGTTQIDYILGTGCMASAMITVNLPPLPVTGFNEVCVGYNTTLFDASPWGAWSSINTTIATIDPGAGIVTGMAPGTTTISYTLLTTGCASSITFSVSPLPSAISGNTYICLGSSYVFTDLIGGGTWISSNPSVAGVAGTGPYSATVTGLGLGTSTIFYTLPAGCAANITVTVVPLPTVFSVTGGGSFCSDDSGAHIGLNGSVKGTNYFLYNGGKIATGPLAGSGSALDFGLQKAGGTYTVNATNTLTGCSAFMSGSAIINNIPIVKPTAGITSLTGDTVCNGVSATFTSVITGGGPSPVYKWDVNGTVVGSGTGYTFIPADGDIVTFRLTSDVACARPAVVSSFIKMKVVLPETPSVVLSTYPGDTICEGFTVTITPVPTYGGSSPSYTWMKDGTFAGTGSTFTYVPVKGDWVYCKMTSNYMCLVTKTVPSNTVAITVDSPLIPNVTIKADPGTSIALGQALTLTAVVTNAVNPTYQWFINGLPQPGATTNTFTTSKASQYLGQQDSISCVVTSNGLCNITTHQWLYTSVHNVGVKSLSTEGGLSVLPNPNKGEFVIKGSLGTINDAEVSFEITDLLGQVVYRNSVLAKNGTINERIKLSNTLANGIYILSVRSEAGNNVFHIVIEQ